QAEDGIRYRNVTGVQTCALPISLAVNQYLSKDDLYDVLIDGEDYSEDLAQYAVDNVDVDWKEIALDYADSLRDQDYSEEEVERHIGLAEFKEDEIQYALGKSDDSDSDEEDESDENENNDEAEDNEDSEDTEGTNDDQEESDDQGDEEQNESDDNQDNNTSDEQESTENNDDEQQAE